MNAVKFYTGVVPSCPLAGLPEFFLCAPGHVVDNSSDSVSPSIRHKVDAVRCPGSEKWQKKSIGVCRLFGRDIFLVENIVKQCGCQNFRLNKI